MKQSKDKLTKSKMMTKDKEQIILAIISGEDKGKQVGRIYILEKFWDLERSM